MIAAVAGAAAMGETVMEGEMVLHNSTLVGKSPIAMAEVRNIVIKATFSNIIGYCLFLRGRTIS